MRKIFPILGTCVGILIYFAVVHLSVEIEIVGLQEQYSIGDTIDFSAKVSGIGNIVYSYSIQFENNDKSANIMGLHRSGLGPTYLDPPFSFFSEEITYSKQIESDVAAGKYGSNSAPRARKTHPRRS